MPVSYDDEETDNALWASSNSTGRVDDLDDMTGSLDLVPLPPQAPRAPQSTKAAGQDNGSGGGAMVNFVDLDKLLKGPIDEVRRNNSPGDAEFLVAHMKASLAGLAPTIESFEA
jgi:hypothetical protein